MARRRQHFKDHWKEQRLFLSRVIGAGVIVVLLTGVLIARLVQLQVVDYQRFSELSQGNQLKIEPLAPTRGLIFDRNGLTLAENVPTWQLVAVPEQIEDLETMLPELEALGLLDPGDRPVLVDLIRSSRRFQRVTLTNLNEVQAARFAARRHRYPGIDIQEGLIRYYPYGEAVAHAIGYVGAISATDLEQIDRRNYSATSQIGKSGIERSYEELLHGTAGYRQQVVNAQGRVLLDPAVDVDSDSAFNGLGLEIETQWPEPGRHLVLAIDVRLQLAAQRSLAGLRGAAVAIDPQSGDLLALVSSPSFDPNRFAGGLSRAELVSLSTDIDKPLFNRALAGRYPPGSTVKPFIGLAGLHNEAATAADEHYCPGFFMLPGSTHRYRDWRPQGHGDMTLHSAIVESCDVYFYQLATDLGIDQIETFMKSFGFGARTGIDISGENGGLVPSREWKRTRFSRREDQVWFPGETVITGIGQGFTQVTPIQLAHATAVMAARGARFRPRLLIGTEDSATREVEYIEPEAQPPVAGVDPQHWQYIHESMVGVTTELRGSARTAMLGAQYEVAGKTGTSQVFSVAQEEEYDEEAIDERLRDHGLFVAYAPAAEPTIAIAVVVENNGGGSRTAAPVVRKLLDTYFGTDEYVARRN